MAPKYKIIDDQTVLDTESNSFIPATASDNADTIAYRDWLMKGGVPDQASPRANQGRSLEQQLAEIEDGRIVIKQDAHNLVAGRTLNELVLHPQVIYRFADSFDVYTPNVSLVSSLEIRQRYATYSTITPANALVQFGFNVAIDNGTYELQSLGIRDRNCGVIRLEINGIDQGFDIDWYLDRTLLRPIEASAYNAEFKNTIIVKDKGINRFVFTVARKNTASAGFAVMLTRFAMKKIS